MESTVVVAIISFLGTLVGTAGGIIASSKLTQYRLEQLEKKVDSQNVISSKIPVLEEKISNINRRIQHIEKQEKYNYGYLDSSQ
ncbi:MAG: hypothetical protein IJD55_01205 [Clostridia bacterium]|nr:hypothetical protein [Clostridia bacterium]